MKKYFLIFSILLLTNCQQETKKTKFRIVDLDGNPHNVQMKTPDLNMQALADQGNLSEERIATQPKKADNTGQMQVASNKYADDAKISGTAGTVNSTAAEALSKTEQMPQSPQQKAPEVNEGEILTAGNIAKNQSVEYNLTKNDKPLANFTAPKEDNESTTKISKKQKGIFVQTGSFSSLERAKIAAAKVSGFVTKAHPLNIEEATNKERKIYRILIGPFASKAKAKITIDKMAKLGHQAIIIKNK